MPDLKSELSKVINSWETPVSTPTPILTRTEFGRPITNNATRVTFNHIRDNPGVTRADAIAALTKIGVKAGSSTSLIAVLLARGNLRLTNGGLFATQSEYKPLPSPARRPKKAPAPVAKPAVVEAPVETPKAAEVDRQFMDAETLLNHLSIKQARALYDELRKIFGG